MRASTILMHTSAVISSTGFGGQTSGTVGVTPSYGGPGPYTPGVRLIGSTFSAVYHGAQTSVHTINHDRMTTAQ